MPSGRTRRAPEIAGSFQTVTWMLSSGPMMYADGSTDAIAVVAVVGELLELAIEEPGVSTGRVTPCCALMPIGVRRRIKAAEQQLIETAFGEADSKTS